MLALFSNLKKKIYRCKLCKGTLQKRDNDYYCPTCRVYLTKTVVENSGEFE